jgi:membrane-associated HD superfamily phosphohydrolase
MSTKQIQFNPLFLVGGSSKTKKKNAPKSAPLISPNILKNKLLKKIKEHKSKEINEHNKAIAEKKKLEKVASSNNKTLTSFYDDVNDTKNNITEYTDDFNDSLKYLRSLKKKHDEEQQLLVNLDLPEELMESFCTSSSPLTPLLPLIKHELPPPPPWGVLKNGNNPTYRQYTNKTLKNYSTVLPPPLPPSTVLPHPLPPSTVLPERELKLEEMRYRTKLENASTSTSMCTKQKIKRTTKRKYILGKSKNKRTVGVLLKDKNTRKQIIQAQKDLKSEPINDVKKYLRNHNLIKIGSFAPHDVVRKMYESAMFAGDITNNNEETMLHNFVKDNNEQPVF